MMEGRSLAGRISQYGALLLLVQLAGACSDERQPNDAAQREVKTMAPATTEAPAKDARLVVAFGDSLFAGYGLAQDEGFAPALQRALEGQGLKAQVVNAGVSGETTAGGRERLAFTLDGLPRKPDLVIVGLGGNDMLRGLDPAQTRANLDAILAELKARGIATMLTGMLVSPNMGPDYAAAFNPIYPDLAKKFGLPLYPFFLQGVVGRRDLQLPDGIHPNAQGIKAVVQRIAPLVGRELKA
jgi:acyl-CoA thioesterase-1